ncbi:MAG: outer membrane PBP1 activator LpoA protein [Halieaceae bacterium]|jgi:outer membrane PBP1 activator LpoA protein
MISNPFSLRVPQLLAILLLSACSSTPEQPIVGSDLEDSIKRTDAHNDESANAGRPLELLAAGLFMDVQRSLARQDYDRALDQLRAADLQTLSADEVIVHTLLTKRIFEANNDYLAALNLLSRPEMRVAIIGSEKRIRRQYLREAADLFSDTGNYTHAAALLIEHTDNGKRKSTSADLRQRIWLALCRASQPEFDYLLANNPDLRIQGWLSLASISRSNNSNLALLLDRTERWLVEWADHSASDIGEKLSRQLRDAVTTRPRHLALLLPLSGRLATTGKAIRDGFLAAHYTASNEAGGRPQLTILDTAAGASMGELYRDAEKLGAELVIGPLLKSKVEQLHQLTPRSTPILALNWISTGAIPENFYQLALAAEDETGQLAQAANFRSPGSALIVRPEGRWGERAARALQEQWLALGNEVPATAVFGRKTDLSTAIKQALDIGESEERARALARILGVSSEFTPRRRQDIDAVFLLSARPDQARTIPPMLAFHYAGNIPIYSISNSHDTRISTGSLGDLEGLVFTEMPWVLLPGAAARAAVAGSPIGMANQSRMFALGADAYNLHPRLGILGLPESSIFRGETGTLSLGEGHQLHRELLIAAIQSGQIQLQTALPPTPQEPR